MEMDEKELLDLKKSFDENGFALVPGFLDRQEVALLNEKLETFIREVVPFMPSEHVFYEGQKDPALIKQMQDLSCYDPFFDRMLNGSRFEQLAVTLLGERVIPKNIEFFNKPPKVGKATPPHQDGYYFMLRPPQAVTMWLALEEVDEENGCVRYVTGSHHKGMRPHGKTNVLGFSQGITDFGTAADIALEKALPAKPGDLLVHHALTIHRAGVNQSLSRSRKAMGLVYFAAAAQEGLEAKAAYQKALLIERSLKEKTCS